MKWIIREIHDMIFRGPGARIKPRVTLGLGACFSDDVLLLRCANFEQCHTLEARKFIR